MLIRTLSKAFKAIVAAIAISLFSPVYAAHATDPAAYGVVTNASGQPIAGVQIIASQNGSAAGSTTTDSTGHYAMYLADGTYTFSYNPNTPSYTSLASLPITLPQNWPLNVVLNQPGVGKVFLKGFIGIDGGIPAASADIPSTAFCGNGGNYSDSHSYFTLAEPAGTNCSLGFNGTVHQNSTDYLNFNLANGPSIAVNQDMYVDAIAPTAISTIRVVDPSGKQLTAADGVSGVQLDIGGETYTNVISSVGGKFVSKQVHKAYPNGTTRLFGGTQSFQSTWSASTTNVDSNGVMTLKRLAMTQDVTGLASVFFTNPKWISNFKSEVLITANGGAITVVAQPNNQTSMSGKVTYVDGTPATGVSVSSGVLGVNTGGTVDANGNYSTTFPTGSLTNYFSVGGNKTYPDDSYLGWYYQINFPGQVLNANINQDFVIPKPTTQQVTVLDGFGNPIPSAYVSIGQYTTSGPDYSGDPAYPLMPSLPKAKLSWSSSSTTNSSGIVQMPAMPMSAPQSMWVSVSPQPGIWQHVDKLMTIGNGPIAIQLTATTIKATGSITSSDGLPIITPTVSYGFTPPTGTGISGGGVRADTQNKYLMMIPKGLLFNYSISSRQQDISNPDPIGFSLAMPKSASITAQTDIAQDFVLPISYQKVKVVDPQGAPIIGAKITMYAGSDSAPASVVVAPNFPAFTGYYWGYSTTGLDGYASVPGLVNSQILPATIGVNTDFNSRYLSKTITTQVGDRKNIVIVLAIKPPTITALSTTAVRVGETFSLTGTGFLGATSVTIGGVSANYTVNSDTQITVYAPSNGTGGSIVVTNGGGTSTSTGTVTVSQTDLSISTATLPSANQGVNYQATLAAVGGTTPYSWSRVALGLPNGLTISPAGVISGTPLQAGSWSFTLGLSDSSGKTVIKVFTIAVAADPKLIPDAPAGLKATQAAGRINISWNPTINDHGNPISGYLVQTSTNQSTWTTQVANTLSSTTSASFAMPVGTYYVRIAAINASGTSAYSNIAGPVTIAGAPSAPTNVTVAAFGGSIRTSWTAPSSGGSPITGYRVRYSQDGVNWTTVIANTGSTTTSYSFAAPGKGTFYAEVAAINAVDLGAYGVTSNQVVVQ